MPRANQEFDIAFRAPDRALNRTDDMPAWLFAKPSGDTASDFRVQGRLAYHPASAHATFADLELWLDQSDQIGVGRCQCQCRRQHYLQPDETGVADDHIDRFGDLFGAQVARIDPFEHHDSRILAQLPCQLTVAYIDGKHSLGAAAQKHIRKSAGRRADIERDLTPGVKAEIS